MWLAIRPLTPVTRMRELRGMKGSCVILRGVFTMVQLVLVEVE